MDSLIDSIQSLEKQANGVVEKARVKAQDLDTEADREIQVNRDEVMAAVEKRVAASRSEAEKKFQQDMEAAQKVAREELQAVDRISADVVKKQVTRIVERFRTL